MLSSVLCQLSRSSGWPLIMNLSPTPQFSQTISYTTTVTTRIKALTRRKPIIHDHIMCIQLKWRRPNSRLTITPYGTSQHDHRWLQVIKLTAMMASYRIRHKSHNTAHDQENRTVSFKTNAHMGIKCHLRNNRLQCANAGVCETVWLIDCLSPANHDYLRTDRKARQNIYIIHNILN